MKKFLAVGVLTAALVTGTSGMASATVRRPPAGCLAALDAAEDLFTEAAAAFTTVSDTFNAAAAFDTAAINRGAERLRVHGATVGRLRRAYNVVAAKCRAGR